MVHPVHPVYPCKTKIEGRQGWQVRFAERERGRDPWRPFCLSRALPALCRGVCGSIERPAGDGIGFHVSTNLPGTRRRSHVWERNGRSCGPVTACWEPATRSRPMPPATAAVGLPHSESPYPWIGPRILQPGPSWEREPIARSAARSRSWSGRPGRAGVRILLLRTTNTDAAYNSWGGYTLYSGPDGPAHRVSFDRPMPGSPRMASTCSPSKAGLRRTWMSGVFPSLCRRLSGGRNRAVPHSFVQVTHPAAAGTWWFGNHLHLEVGRAAATGLRWIHHLGKRMAQLGAILGGLGRAVRLFAGIRS